MHEVVLRNLPFLLTIKMGSNYEKSRDALSHPSGDR